eukprot:402744-Rhodomonas_salina.2
MFREGARDPFPPPSPPHHCLWLRPRSVGLRLRLPVSRCGYVAPRPSHSRSRSRLRRSRSSASLTASAIPSTGFPACHVSSSVGESEAGYRSLSTSSSTADGDGWQPLNRLMLNSVELCHTTRVTVRLSVSLQCHGTGGGTPAVVTG